MPDPLTPEQRHYCMSRIHSRNTKPELKVRQWLWMRGYRYRLNVRSVPGKPDIVLRRYRTAIFVNGCFWHGHEDCGKFRMPKSNVAFWQAKISHNRERDARNYQILQQNGWQVIVVWECQLTTDRFERTMWEVEVLLNRNFLAINSKTHAYALTDDEPLPMAAEPETKYGE